MDPRDFFRLAQRLAGENGPAEIRTAISRAYYAAHNVGVEVLKGMNFRINTGASGHGEVWNRLSNSGDHDVERAGSQLGSLYSNRLSADYHLNDKKIENQKTALLQVSISSQIIQALDLCRNEPKHTQIATAIKDWEKKISGI